MEGSIVWDVMDRGSFKDNSTQVALFKFVIAEQM
jgi:hypothetical protein